MKKILWFLIFCITVDGMYAVEEIRLTPANSILKSYNGSTLQLPGAPKSVFDFSNPLVNAQTLNSHHSTNSNLSSPFQGCGFLDFANFFSHKAEVILELTNPGNWHSNTINYNIPLKIELWTIHQNPSVDLPSKTVFSSLSVFYNQASGNSKSNLYSSLLFDGFSAVKVTQDNSSNKTASIPYSDLTTNKVIIELKYKITSNISYKVDQLSHNLVSTIDADNTTYSGVEKNTLVVNFNTPILNTSYSCITSPSSIKPDEYDVEWSFLDYNAEAALPFKSNTNSSHPNKTTYSRVTVSGQYGKEYRIPLVYRSGFILYRVRPVSYFNGNRIEGSWSFGGKQIGDHEKKLNWTSTLTFAEEGKRKQVVSYFDGSQRERQTVTMNSSLNIALFTESFYDFMGRKSIVTLPAPSLTNEVISSTFGSKTVSQPASSIKFLKNQTLFNATSIFKEIHFNKNPNPQLGICKQDPSEAMSALAGSSLYYSSSNKLHENSSLNTIQRYLNLWVPTAGGFPFSQTKFSSDGKNRVTFQSGVGEHHKIASGHETKYFYTGSNSQDELDRMFGTDVGNHKFYSKTYIEDPNGQTSVSYQDMNGKTIATALIGNLPTEITSATSNQTLVDPLPSYAAATQPFDFEFMHHNYMQKDLENSKLLGSTSHFVPLTQQNVIFNLKLSHTPITDDYQSNICKEEPIKEYCADCFYDVNFKVLDDCGNIEFAQNYTNYGSNIAIDKVCNNSSPEISESITRVLNKGNHFISSNVAVSETHANLYTQKYMEDIEKCEEFKIETFIKKYTDAIDPFDCINTCEECNKEKDKGIEAYKTRTRLNFIKFINSGQIKLEEVDGIAIEQFERLKARCNTICQGSKNLECDYYKTQMKNDVGRNGQYGLKLNPNTGEFEVENPSVLFFAINNSKFKTADGYLIQSINDLIINWTDAWLEELITYHPEYCYLQNCENSATLNNNFQNAYDAAEKFICPSNAVNPLILSADISSFGPQYTQMYNDFRFYNPSFNFPGMPISIKKWAYILAFIGRNNEGILSTTSGDKYSLGSFEQDPCLSELCEADKALYWEFYKSLLLNLRNYFKYKKMSEVPSTCIPNTFIGCGNTINNNTSEYEDLNVNNNLFKDVISPPQVGPCPNQSTLIFNYNLSGVANKVGSDFTNKKKVFLYFDQSTQNLVNGINNLINSSTGPDKDKANNVGVAEKENAAIKMCEMNSQSWVDDISYCIDNSINYSGRTKEAIVNEIKANFVKVCKVYVNSENYPMGTKSLNASDPTVQVVVNGTNRAVRSFQEILDLYPKKSPILNPNPFCNADLVSGIPYYGVEQEGLFPDRKYNIAPKKSTCECDQINHWEYKYKMEKIPMSFHEYMSANDLSFKITEEELNLLVEGCKNDDAYCRFIGKPFSLPNAFMCKKFYNCNEYTYLKELFKEKYKNITWSLYPKTVYENTLTSYMNSQKGMNLNFTDYLEFENKCASCVPNDLLEKNRQYQLIYNEFIALPSNAKFAKTQTKFHLEKLADFFNTKLGYTANNKMDALQMHQLLCKYLIDTKIPCCIQELYQLALTKAPPKPGNSQKVNFIALVQHMNLLQNDFKLSASDYQVILNSCGSFAKVESKCQDFHIEFKNYLELKGIPNNTNIHNLPVSLNNEMVDYINIKLGIKLDYEAIKFKLERTCDNQTIDEEIVIADKDICTLIKDEMIRLNYNPLDFDVAYSGFKNFVDASFNELTSKGKISTNKNLFRATIIHCLNMKCIYNDFLYKSIVDYLNTNTNYSISNDNAMMLIQYIENQLGVQIDFNYVVALFNKFEKCQGDRCELLNLFYNRFTQLNGIPGLSAASSFENLKVYISAELHTTLSSKELLYLMQRCHPNYNQVFLNCDEIKTQLKQLFIADPNTNFSNFIHHPNALSLLNSNSRIQYATIEDWKFLIENCSFNMDCEFIQLFLDRMNATYDAQHDNNNCRLHDYYTAFNTFFDTEICFDNVMSYILHCNPNFLMNTSSGVPVLPCEIDQSRRDAIHSNYIQFLPQLESITDLETYNQQVNQFIENTKSRFNEPCLHQYIDFINSNIFSSRIVCTEMLPFEDFQMVHQILNNYFNQIVNESFEEADYFITFLASVDPELYNRLSEEGKLDCWLAHFKDNFKSRYIQQINTAYFDEIYFQFKTKNQTSSGNNNTSNTNSMTVEAFCKAIKSSITEFLSSNDFNRNVINKYYDASTNNFNNTLVLMDLKDYLNTKFGTNHSICDFQLILNTNCCGDNSTTINESLYSSENNSDACLCKDKWIDFLYTLNINDLFNSNTYGATRSFALFDYLNFIANNPPYYVHYAKNHHSKRAIEAYFNHIRGLKHPIFPSITYLKDGNMVTDTVPFVLHYDPSLVRCSYGDPCQKGNGNSSSSGSNTTGNTLSWIKGPDYDFDPCKSIICDGLPEAYAEVVAQLNDYELNKEEDYDTWFSFVYDLMSYYSGRYFTAEELKNALLCCGIADIYKASPTCEELLAILTNANLTSNTDPTVSSEQAAQNLFNSTFNVNYPWYYWKAKLKYCDKDITKPINDPIDLNFPCEIEFKHLFFNEMNKLRNNPSYDIVTALDRLTFGQHNIVELILDLVMKNCLSCSDFIDLICKSPTFEAHLAIYAKDKYGITGLNPRNIVQTFLANHFSAICESQTNLNCSLWPKSPIFEMETPLFITPDPQLTRIYNYDSLMYHWMSASSHTEFETYSQKFQLASAIAIALPPPPPPPSNSQDVVKINVNQNTNPYNALIPGFLSKNTSCCFSCDHRLYDKLKRKVVEEINPCEYRYNLAITNAISDRAQMLKEKAKDYKRQYMAKCLSSIRYTVNATLDDQQHHYTLYYYDQSGNLVKTIPPAGVRMLTSAQVKTDLANARATNSSFVPQHQMPTKYWYNMQEQVIKQTSPDAGQTVFIYDEIGRLILSQNAKQFPKRFSYTKYDRLNRILESGEIEYPNHTANSSVLYASNHNHYYNYDEGGSNLHRMKYCNFEQLMLSVPSNAVFRYVVRTFYDRTPLSPNIIPSGQTILTENTDKRIVATTLDEEDTDRNPETYSSALFYSYDILGNVKKLYTLQRFQGSLASSRLKTVDYHYDLQSGKVNKVYYQKDQPDQFIHRYQYDADNRLLLAETSFDDYIYQKEATYQYYLHGPLARINVGEHQVQGIDYLYTIQGWLKAVNGSTLDILKEPGQDGRSGQLALFNPNGLPTAPNAHHTASDAVAFSLNYFQGDYSPVGGATFAQNLLGKINPRNLYNGNITSMYQDNKALENPTANQSSKMYYSYNYDQLHRIVRMDAYQKTPTQAAFTPINDFAETVQYDPNGNILNYFRNGANATSKTVSNMDDLSYQYYYKKYDPATNSYSTQMYQPNTTPLHPKDILTNRLAQVSDGIQNSAYPDDIESGQAAQNYQYDAIGNLTADNQAGINIEWTPTGKIAKINNTIKNEILTFAYDPMGHRIMKKVSTPTQTHTTLYSRDAQGNVLATYDFIPWMKIDGPRLDKPNEMMIYGSSRLGVKRPLQQRANSITNHATVSLSVTSGFFPKPFAEVQAEVCGNSGPETYVEPALDYTDVNYFRKHINESSTYQVSTVFGNPPMSYLYPEFTCSKNLTHTRLFTGMSEYELTNHLGNVLATVKDEPILTPEASLSPSNEVAFTKKPLILTAQDYYPFGMPMPNRSFSLAGSNYRFGFNTQEKDDEVYGKGNLMTADYWEYDTRIGRRWNVDPIVKVWESPYATNYNNPNAFYDPLGLTGESGGVRITVGGGKKGGKTPQAYEEGKVVISANRPGKKGFFGNVLSGIGKVTSSVATTLSKGYQSLSKWFKTDVQPFGFNVHGTTNSRSFEEIKGKAEEVQNLDISDLVTPSSPSSKGLLDAIGDHADISKDVKMATEIFTKSFEKLEKMMSFGEKVVEASPALNNTNAETVKSEVNQTNKENMGVKQRKAFDDIKDGDVYHDARIGRDFTKKSKSKSQIIYGKANVSKDDTINQYKY